jgi:hypothetical protein
MSTRTRLAALLALVALAAAPSGCGVLGGGKTKRF